MTALVRGERPEFSVDKAISNWLAGVGLRIATPNPAFPVLVT